MRSSLREHRGIGLGTDWRVSAPGAGHGWHTVYGYDVDPATRAAAQHAAQAPAAARWQVAGSVPDAVARAELVVVAVPLPAVDEVSPTSWSVPATPDWSPTSPR